MGFGSKVRTLRRPTRIKFTSIEFLVVIAIVALIAFVLVPAIEQAGAPPYSLKEMSDLRQIGIAMHSYAEDYEGVLPSHPRDIEPYLYEGFEVLFESPYPDAETILDRGDYEGPAVQYGCYVFVNLGENLSEFEKPQEVVLGYAAKVSRKQHRLSMLYMDGHVESFTEEELASVLNLNSDSDVDAMP